MPDELKSRLRRSFFVFTGASGASFLTMMFVQLFMGGIAHVDLALGKSFMVGLGIALFVLLLPVSRQEKYPWQ